MSAVKDALVTGFTLAITLLVPTIVWLTLASGLYQLARDGLRRLHLARPRLHRTAHKPVS